MDNVEDKTELKSDWADDTAGESERVQPCADCGRHTLRRDDQGVPMNGQCEYFRVANSLWDSVASDARFLCVGCLEKRLGRKLVWEDFLITGDEVSVREWVRGRLVWCDTSQFDTPRLAKRKWPGPSRGQQRHDSILMVKAEVIDFDFE
jgi:hypothetical protein